MFQIENKQLTPAEIETMDLEFYSKIISDPEASEEAVARFIAVFKNISVSKDRDYWMGNFRWFTELIWRRFNSFPKELIIEMAIARQVPMAILLDYDVWTDIMWYLAGRTSFSVIDLQDLYYKIRKAFFESEAVVGLLEGKEITVREIVEEIKKINQPESSSLEAAELLSKIRGILFPQNDQVFEKYITTDPGIATDRFVGLVNFFLGIEPDKIWYVVNAFLYPERYGGITAQPESVTVLKPTTPPAQSKPVAPPSIPAPKPAAVPASLVPTKKEVPINKGIAASVAPLPPRNDTTKLTPAQIKSQIESQFKKDAEGNFADVEGVMAKLSELALKNNDPTISEMLYYDETENKFKWTI